VSAAWLRHGTQMNADKSTPMTADKAKACRFVPVPTTSKRRHVQNPHLLLSAFIGVLLSAFIGVPASTPQSG